MNPPETVNDRTPRSGGGEARPPAGELGVLARAFIKSFEFRQSLFGKDLFHDPATNMLLLLFVADVEGRSVSTTSVLGESLAAETTASRWLNLLLERGLIMRKPDPEDGRRQLVMLTPDGRHRTEMFLMKVARLIPAGGAGAC